MAPTFRGYALRSLLETAGPLILTGRSTCNATEIAGRKIGDQPQAQLAVEYPVDKPRQRGQQAPCVPWFRQQRCWAAPKNTFGCLISPRRTREQRPPGMQLVGNIHVTIASFHRPTPRVDGG